MAAHQRPLSPHLQIYSRQLTSVLSILHRATGVLLAIGAFILMFWLLAASSDAAGFAKFNAWIGSTAGRIVMLLVLASLMYHLLNGVRHLLWDIGWGFELPKVYATGWTVVVLAILATGGIAFAAMDAGALP